MYNIPVISMEWNQTKKDLLSFTNVLSGKYGKRYTHTHTRTHSHLLDTQNATLAVCSGQISNKHLEHLPLKVTT